MSAAFLPAVAAGALLAFVAQLPPSLSTAQSWLPVVLGSGIPAAFGSLPHRAPRHETPRVLQRSDDRAINRSRFRSTTFAVAAPAADNRAARSVLTSHRRQGGPRRPWGPAPRAFHSWEGGAAQAGGMPAPDAQRSAQR